MQSTNYIHRLCCAPQISIILKIGGDLWVKVAAEREILAIKVSVPMHQVYGRECTEISFAMKIGRS
jgi:hypothetical protein